MKDEFIIREVVTKGKHIEFCLKFLTKKRKGNAEETKKYFWEQVSFFFHMFFCLIKKQKQHCEANFHKNRLQT